MLANHERDPAYLRGGGALEIKRDVCIRKTGLSSWDWLTFVWRDVQSFLLYILQ